MVPGIDTAKISKPRDADTAKTVTPVAIPDTLRLKTPTGKDSVMLANVPVKKEKVVAPAPVEIEDKNPPITSLIQLDSLKADLVLENIRQQNLKRLILRNEQKKLEAVLRINNLDTLKLQLKTTTSDTVRALICTRIALKYLSYDTISDPEKQAHYQNAAINYTLLAIHSYSSYNDSTALRDAYANLSKVYHSQKKYTEAKWFILQSNTLSREKKDTPNIISSLLALASIKSDIMDYTLAMSDLDEALQLSITTHAPKAELEVLKNYAQLYNILENYPKEAAVIKMRDALLDSIHKNEEAQLAKTADLEKKKLDSLNKKKLLAINSKKPSKNGSAAKTASL